MLLKIINFRIVTVILHYVGLHHTPLLLLFPLSQLCFIPTLMHNIQLPQTKKPEQQPRVSVI